MEESYRDVQDRMRRKMRPTHAKRGVIESVNVAQWTAKVRLIGGSQSVNEEIPMNALISPKVQPGDMCVVDVFDENNPKDSIVSYTYGRKFKDVKSGTANIAGASPTTVNHDMGVVPNILSVLLTENPAVVKTPSNIKNKVWMTALPTSSVMTFQSIPNDTSPDIGIMWYTVSS